MPILGAVLIGGALTIDEFHSRHILQLVRDIQCTNTDRLADWWDIVAGALIGTMMAASAYRMVYASIWNHRFNHIPLYPDAPQAATRSMAPRAPVFTRRAGWGTGNSVPVSGPAPLSPTHGPRLV